MMLFSFLSQCLLRNERVIRKLHMLGPVTSNYIIRKIKYSRNVSVCLISSFHSSAALSKAFPERENELAHSIMENLTAYKDTIINSPCAKKEKDNFSQNKEVTHFEQVTIDNLLCGLTLENSQFTPLIEKVVSKLQSFTDTELLKILNCICLWPPTPKTWTPNYKLLWNTVDAECVSRLKRWDVNTKLLVADYWFHLRLNRISLYNRQLIENLLQCLNQLSNQQVVQLMFYINLQRKVAPTHFTYLEKRLLVVINYVGIEEIGIICLGFFKTENKISDVRIIKGIIDCFCREVGRMSKATAVAILKFLKKSFLFDYVDLYIPLLHKSVNYVDSWDILASVHLALLSAECHIYHPLLLNTVSAKVMHDVSDARLKDCMKLLQSVSHFNHTECIIGNIDCGTSFVEMFFKEIRKDCRQEEILKFPRDLVNSTQFLAYMGIYNQDLLKKVLSPQFVESSSLRHPETKSTIAEIDYCVEIECKNYEGPRLHKSLRQILKNRRGNMPHAETQNMAMRLTNDVTLALEDLLGGGENILVHHILPHIYSPDIIVRLDKSSSTMKELYEYFPSDTILHPPKQERWACFVIGTKFLLAYRSKQPTGVLPMKLRQLKVLGYKVVLLPYYDIPRDSSARKIFLKEKLEQF